MLAEQYEIHDAVVTPIEHGHTNASFAVHGNGAHYVLRRAWAGKPMAQISDEEYVLARLATAFDIPRIVPTLVGTPHAIVDGRVHHLFVAARGEVGPRYLAPGDHARMCAAMTRLAELHRALAEVPCDRATGTPWLEARLSRVHSGPPGVERILARIREIIPATESAQWLHGDYHLGNLLWTGDQVTGIVDFDDVARGSAALEAGMALFALARQPAGEDGFAFDADLWETGRAAYPGPVAGDARVFCAYQVLIHLEASQRGLWQLTDGIGFWPCWNSL